MIASIETISISASLAVQTGAYAHQDRGCGDLTGRNPDVLQVVLALYRRTLARRPRSIDVRLKARRSARQCSPNLNSHQPKYVHHRSNRILP